MEVKMHVVRFADEWYMEDGQTDLRDHLGKPVKNCPKFVKTTLEQIKQLEKKPEFLQLQSDCEFAEIGFTAPRTKEAFGEKTKLYAITKIESGSQKDEPLPDIAKIFADKFRVYAEGTKNNKKGAKQNDRFNTTSYK